MALGRADVASHHERVGLVDELRDVCGLYPPVGLMECHRMGLAFYRALGVGAPSLLSFRVPDGHAF